jgi:hypothetical protein
MDGGCEFIYQFLKFRWLLDRDLIRCHYSARLYAVHVSRDGALAAARSGTLNCSEEIMDIAPAGYRSGYVLRSCCTFLVDHRFDLARCFDFADIQHTALMLSPRLFNA